MPRAKTFLDDQTIEVEIISKAPSSTGLLIVELDDKQKIVRHTSRLEALDDEASDILKKDWKKPEDN